MVSVRSDGVTYPSISSTKAAYNYCNVLAASNLFYEAQKLGKLTGVSRVPFKFDCMLADKGNNGEDLTGGYQDGMCLYLLYIHICSLTDDRFILSRRSREIRVPIRVRFHYVRVGCN